jgi:dolichol-phosphate mannosyltransferase
MRDEATTVDIGSADLEGAGDIERPRGAGLAAGAVVQASADGPDAGGPGAGGPKRMHVRLLHGMRHPANWLQLIRFSIVGASGYAVNLLVYYVEVHQIGIEYRAAAAIAWMVAAGNNFVWNRHWTFKARDGQIHVQALRFLFVSLIALGVNLLVLTLLVQAWGVDKIAAQAIALAASTPLNFLGNKLWSFRADLYSEPSPPQER